ncbi:hypothetical protein DFJ63DRAFT_337489 [Scheffersomyces coipomensis]|uniref:uncharacterized protein n=1 Tax=Scheffersomyces coipomensis TaxID=1788519 RepID=UPI00315C6B29
MAPKVRQDLVVPFRHAPAAARGDASSMISQTLPMAAMFMRNKMLSWAAVFLAIQAFLNEPVNVIKKEGDTSQPPALRIGFALISLVTCYIDIFFPGTMPGGARKAADIASATASIVDAAST